MEPWQSPQEPLLNIIGDKIALGPLRRELMPLYMKWINDFENTRNLDTGIRPITWEAEEAWYVKRAKSEDEQVFIIYELDTKRPIGNTGLHQIDHFHQTAEFGILIGEKDCWNKGYGTEVASLMLDFGFNALGLHNIMLRVYSYNVRAVSAYKHAGFRLIGHRREARRLSGQPFEVIYMDCLSTEFRSPKLRRLLIDQDGTSSEMGRG